MANQTPARQNGNGQQHPAQQVSAQLDKMDDKLKAALPKHIPVDRFKRTVMTALNNDPGLLKAERQSLFNACLKCAQDGLLPDGREAALVIYRTKNKQTGRYEDKAQYLPMIYGLHKKVRQSGEISLFNAFVVYENDEFDVRLGLEMDLTHKPNLWNRGQPIGAYAVAKFSDGAVDFEVMTVDEIENVRKRSKAANNGPWVTDWGEMARKTVARRLGKRLPMSNETQQALRRLDEMYDLPQDQWSETTAPASAQQVATSRLDALAHHADEAAAGEGQDTTEAPADEPDPQPEPAPDPGADSEPEPDETPADQGSTSDEPDGWQLVDENGEVQTYKRAFYFTQNLQSALKRNAGHPDAVQDLWERNQDTVMELQAAGRNTDVQNIRQTYNDAFASEGAAE